MENEGKVKREKRPTCHDCGCSEGQLHNLGCDMESCPFCGGQLISCDCPYEKLGFTIDPDHPTAGLPEDIYHNGLTGDLYDRWDAMLNKKGRVPYIVWPVLCAKCGVLWPDFFKVDDATWQKYIEPMERDKVICKDCWNYIYLVTTESVVTESYQEIKRAEGAK